MVDKVKKELYKRSRLEGKSKERALLDAGCSIKTARHKPTSTQVAIVGERELMEEFKASKITPEFVLAGLEREALGAVKSSDRTVAYSWLGKYLAMFTDKTEISQPEKEDNQFSLERLSRIKAANLQ